MLFFADKPLSDKSDTLLQIPLRVTSMIALLCVLIGGIPAVIFGISWIRSHTNWRMQGKTKTDREDNIYCPPKDIPDLSMENVDNSVQAASNNAHNDVNHYDDVRFDFDIS